MRDANDSRHAGIRWHLRQATQPLHDVVDGLGSHFDLASGSGYRHFLRAHARALPGLEAALEAAGIARLLPDWPARRRGAALAADLACLAEPPPPAATATLPAGDAALLGAAYVLEGSRFGNAMLLRQVRQGGDPGNAAATDYLSHAADWPAFLARLEAALPGRELWPAAAEGARAAFLHFRRALATEVLPAALPATPS